MREIRCPHCNQTSLHELKSMYNDIATASCAIEAGSVYETLKCLNCTGITIQRHDWHEHMSADAEVVYETIYPLPDRCRPKLMVLK